MENMLSGVIDLHVHGSPSVAVRRDTAEFMREMGKAGYRGFVLKDHYYPSAGVCSMLNQWQGEETGVRAFGSIILNNSVGGLNLYAVDAACNMGAKVVSFPTISAKKHIETMAALRSGFPGDGKGMVSAEANHPITVLDDNGELVKPARDIIEYLSERPDVMLWTGHLSLPEVEKVIEAATAAGLGKIFTNHPYWMIGAPVERLRAWAQKGVYIEMNMSMFAPWGKGKMAVPFSVFREIMDTLPPERMVLDTDLGQAGNPSPVEGMRRFLNDLVQEIGIPREQLDLMTKKVPGDLLGLE